MARKRSVTLAFVGDVMLGRGIGAEMPGRTQAAPVRASHRTTGRGGLAALSRAIAYFETKINGHSFISSSKPALAPPARA